MVAFVRRHEAGDVLVLHNVGPTNIKATLPESLRGFTKVLWASSPEAKAVDGDAVLPQHSSLVLQVP